MSGGFANVAAWGLEGLACVYKTAQVETELARSPPLSYLIRPSGSRPEMLVLALHRGAGTIERLLFCRVEPGVWKVDAGEHIKGTFAEFVRVLVPRLGQPLNDPARAAALEAGGRGDEDLYERLSSSQNNALLHRSDSASAESSSGGEVSGNAVYGSVSAAYRALPSGENDEDVCDGTVWRAVARTDVLEAPDMRHADTDGVFLGVLDFYHFQLDTIGASALLSGRPKGTYLLRQRTKNKGVRQFVASFVRENGRTAHALIELSNPNGQGGYVTAMGSEKFSTVRELIAGTKSFVAPLSRRAAEREFVDAHVVLTANPLGEGAGGLVYRGTLNGKFEVAVKKLSTNGVQSSRRGTYQSAHEKRKQQLDEAQCMLAIPPHPNVNRLFGVVLKPLALVVEYCDGGSLDQVLGIDGPPPTSAKPKQFSPRKCEALALGIACGVAHLHSVDIVHRDLASRNILLHASYIPKVADFGMSRLVQDGNESELNKTESTVGPIKWMAPEQMRGSQRCYSFKSDVFSYAVLLTELVGNSLPWPGTSNVDAAIAVCTKAARTPISPHASPLLVEIIEKCWQQQPQDRPTMEEVIALLKGGEYDDIGKMSQ